MMVSKVAVIALVVIVACPILLGYGMNLEQVTHSGYKESKDPIDVTALLKNNEEYTMAYADVYRINSEFETPYNQKPVMPAYQRSMIDKGSLPLVVGYVNWTGGDWGIGYSNKSYMVYDYNINLGSVVLEVKNSGGVVTTIYGAASFYYDRATDSITYTYFSTLTEMIEEGYISGGNYTLITGTLHGFSYVPTYTGVQEISNYSEYADISAGYRLFADATYPLIVLPENTKAYLMTINLNSATSPNYSFRIDDGYGEYHLNKTTVNGVVTWTCQTNDGEQPIYYDSSRTDNTYQFYREYRGNYEQNGRLVNNIHTELRYVGGWPTLIGEAKSYFTYEKDSISYSLPYNPDLGFNRIRFYDTSNMGYPAQNQPPIIRMDAAKFAAFHYSVIKDKVYDPSSFRSNPITKITDISKFGDYLTFGGVTYAVKDGNITIGSREISIKDLVFESVSVPGGYSNRIGNTEISTTATPSTITFGGSWGANVVTDSMQPMTYTSTEWTPGQFAWNGIDQNFLMIGLLAALGVFIALGIAYRKVKSALFGLLVVCGGAAVLFFTML